MRLRRVSAFLPVLILLSCAFVRASPTSPSSAVPQPINLYFFTAENCPHCQEVRPQLVSLLDPYGDRVKLVEWDIWKDRVAFRRLIELLRTYGDQPVSTPTIFLADHFWIGLDRSQLKDIDNVLQTCLQTRCQDAMTRLDDYKGGQSDKLESLDRDERVRQTPMVELPLLGAMDVRQVSLPLVTLILGLLDSINPCAFFVLLFLLSLLVHAHSRARMLLVGMIFVLFSGLIYFLFMTAWLNLFLLVDGLQIVTLLAGVLAVVIGFLNIKDYFMLNRGLSLSMPDSAKPKLYQRTRQLVQVGSYPVLLGGTVLLAIAANSYELLCTAGFPMVYTRILTMHDLPSWLYYTYLGLYNVVYVIPLLLIVIIFVITLGRHKLTEKEGQVLKLLSGVMMAELGLVLIFWPQLLNNLYGTVLLIVVAFCIIAIVLVISHWLLRQNR